MTFKQSLRTAAICMVAAGLGGAAALLFAPQSGRRTRRQIKRTSLRCWNRFTGEVEKVQNRLTRGKDAAGQGARELGRKLRLASRIA